MIALIAAVAKNGVIGDQGKLPWSLPNDLTHFKRVTDGHVVIMGRKTFESLGSNPLPNRINVVITKNPGVATDNVYYMSSLLKALTVFRDRKRFIIGGARLFEEGLYYADRFYLTRIEEHVAGDTYFPEMDALKWRKRMTKKGTMDERNQVPHTFYEYQRMN